MSKTRRNAPIDRRVFPSQGPTPVGQRNRAKTIPARRRPDPDIREWADEHQRDPIVALVDRLEWELGTDPIPWRELPAGIVQRLTREQFKSTAPDLIDLIADEWEARHG